MRMRQNVKLSITLEKNVNRPPIASYNKHEMSHSLMITSRLWTKGNCFARARPSMYTTV